ncbi:superoxide dismutase family protein [Streptomyces gilvus]|uniref:superoxide dismutase family protein n=1 Tax=Streptomyces gilvus TaxID=2920937 RepID=UPI001F0D4B49|nr:superoxide dismutase family protein [Streptomyces sp. CME 23]MCH5671455.1 superoxide dismutase family protein [Streptomyces sp. CME 23]
MYHRSSAAHPSPSGTPSAPHPLRRAPRLAVGTAFVTALAAFLAGCGGEPSDHAAAKPKTSASAHNMDNMSGMAMGDPSATPAYKIPHAAVVEGTFKLLDTRPPGLDHVKGTAWLAQGAKGTTVTVKLTGLKPGASYMAHLHAQHCSADNGGAHFQFVEGGPAKPPNEVHLMFEADQKGTVMTTVDNARKTGKGAVAIVVHPSDALDNRIACADFAF